MRGEREVAQHGMPWMLSHLDQLARFSPALREALQMGSFSPSRDLKISQKGSRPGTKQGNTEKEGTETESRHLTSLKTKEYEY